MPGSGRVAGATEEAGMAADDVYTASGYPVTTEKITLDMVGVVTHKTYPHEGLDYPFYGSRLNPRRSDRPARWMEERKQHVACHQPGIARALEERGYVLLRGFPIDRFEFGGDELTPRCRRRRRTVPLCLA